MNLTTKRAAFAVLFALLLKAPITFTELALDKNHVEPAFPFGESNLPDSDAASLSDHTPNQDEHLMPQFSVENNHFLADPGHSGTSLNNGGSSDGNSLSPAPGNVGPDARPPVVGPVGSAFPLPADGGGSVGAGGGGPSDVGGGGSPGGPGSPFFPPIPKTDDKTPPPNPSVPDEPGKNQSNPPPVSDNGGDIPVIDTFPPTIPPPNDEVPGDNTFPPPNTLSDSPTDPTPNGPTLDNGNGPTGHVPDGASSAILVGVALTSLVAFRKKFAA